ncbi:MAG: Xaa-Pro peptidase family protein [Pirellulales bacterium]
MGSPRSKAEPSDRFAARRGRLVKGLARHGIDSLLVTNFTNVTYLTGFTGDDTWLLLSRTDAILVSDARYTTQLGQECPALARHIRPTGTSLADAAARVARSARPGRLGIEADSMTVASHARLADKLRKVTVLPTSGLVENLRQIKDREEVAEITLAARQAERAFAVVRAGLRLDQTEKEVADELEHQLRLFGARGSSFAPIVAVGPRAALPHARPGDARIGSAEFVLIDWGATARLYKSDLTRVLVTARISPKLERVYGLVLTAQRRAIEAIRPGVTGREVDAVARGIIADAGFGKYFGHGLGHGVGLDIHEAPRLSVANDSPLKAGMVVTVEPGIYLPGWGGVRIEDDVLVSRAGHRVLTDCPKELEDAVVG